MHMQLHPYMYVYVAIYGYNMSMYGCHAKIMVAKLDIAIN